MQQNKMDSAAVQTGGALGIATFVLSILYKVYSKLNHKKIRVKCCGTEYEVGFDVEEDAAATIEHSQEQGQPTPIPQRPKRTLSIKPTAAKHAVHPSPAGLEFV